LLSELPQAGTIRIARINSPYLNIVFLAEFILAALYAKDAPFAAPR
jgi:hypothetical protein